MSPERSLEEKPLPRKSSEDQPNPHADDQEVFVRRSSGEVVKMRLADNTQLDKHNRRIGYMVELDEEDGNEYIFAHKPLSEAGLGALKQAQLAEEFAAHQQVADDFEVVAAERARQFVDGELEDEISLEKARLSEAQEVVAEVSIGLSTGTENPSEVNDHIHMFSRAEMRAMREASRQPENAPIVEPVFEQSAERNKKNPRLETLFSPPVRPEVPKSTVNLLDAQFSKEDGVYEAALEARLKEDKDNAPILKSQKDFDRITNKDTREYSEQQLAAVMRRDDVIRELLASKGFTEASLAAVDAIREDPELRYAVGDHFVAKLDKLVTADINERGNNFGDRLKQNGQKNNNYIALPVYTSSREYAAYLALAKISGMFNYTEDSSDVFKDQNDNGTIVLNQHRHAADMLL